MFSCLSFTIAKSGIRLKGRADYQFRHWITDLSTNLSSFAWKRKGLADIAEENHSNLRKVTHLNWQGPSLISFMQALEYYLFLDLISVGKASVLRTLGIISLFMVPKILFKDLIMYLFSNNFLHLSYFHIIMLALS